MDRSAAAQKVLILDTCYSGAFAKDYVSKGIAQTVSRDEFGDDQSRGKVVITASTGVQVAFEKLKGSRTQSRFTAHLIEGIETGRADPEGSGKVTVDDLYDYICEELRAERAEDPEAPPQNPQRWYFGLQGSVCIARNPAPPPPELQSELTARLASGDPAVRALAVDDLTALVRSGGRLAPLAVARLFELSDDESNHVGASADRAIRRLGPLAQQPAAAPAAATESRPPVVPMSAQANDPVEDMAPESGAFAPSTEAAQGQDEEQPEAVWHTRPEVRGALALAVLGVLAILSLWGLSGGGPSSETATSEMATPVEVTNAEYASDAASIDAASTAAPANAEVSEPMNAATPIPGGKGFDCKKASMPLDWAICEDPQALDLNTTMSATWDAVHRGLSASERREHVDQQMKWILGTQEKCGLPPRGRPTDAELASAKACVREEYAARIKAIEAAQAAKY